MEPGKPPKSKSIFFIACAPVLIVFVFILSFATPPAHAVITNAYVMDMTNATASMYFDPSAGNYVDGTTVNPDIKLRVYYTDSGELAGKWGGFAYAVNSSFKVVSIVSSTTLDQFGPEQGTPGNYFADTSSFLGFGLASVYPARLFAVISSNSSADSNSEFIFIPGSNGWLRGSITPPSSFPSTYNQANGNISVGALSILGTKADLSNVAIDSEDSQNIAIGVCNDLEGVDCSSSALRRRTGTTSLFTGVSAGGARQYPVTKYLVYNGFTYPFSIGVNIRCNQQAITFNPGSGLIDGDNTTIGASVWNEGTVDSNTTFLVNFYKENVTSQNLLGSYYVGPLAAGASISANLTVNTTGFSKPDGSPTTVWVVCDYGNLINEISELDNNNSGQLQVQKRIYMDIFIDGNQTTNFPAGGRPYTLEAHIYDSANASHQNDIVQVSEYNGISAFAPLQDWTDGDGYHTVSSVSIAQGRANSSGWASMAVVPTGQDELSSLNDPGSYSSLNGQYRAFVAAYTSNSIMISSANLTFSDSSIGLPGTTTVINQLQVGNAYAFVYHMYKNTFIWLQ